MPPPLQRLARLHRQLRPLSGDELLGMAQPSAGTAAEPPAAEPRPPSLDTLVGAADMATFVRDGYLVLPNLVEAGDISQSTCDEIFAEGFAQRDLPGMGEVSNAIIAIGSCILLTAFLDVQSRTALFERISDNMNKVMASPTLRGGLESLLG